MDVSMSGLLSPPASAASPTSSHVSSFATNSVLPAPRRHPLRPGSEKEISLINYIDGKMLRISRRYGKKFTEPESSHDDAPGYMSMQEIVADIDPLVDVVWVSGTRMFKSSWSFFLLFYFRLSRLNISVGLMVRRYMSSSFMSAQRSCHVLTSINHSPSTDLLPAFLGRHCIVVSSSIRSLLINLCIA
jgi:hypothetical protein